MAIHTHYDTLGVARNAPSDAIRAAYKSLILKSKAGQNPGADSAGMMKAIHDSYAVLSNPVLRADYDRWLLERESALVGKGSADSTDGDQGASGRWLVYTLAGAALLIGLGWLGFKNSSVESAGTRAARSDDSSTQQGISSRPAPAPEDADAGMPVESTDTPMVVANGIPEHDQVTVDKFNGTWKGVNGGSDGQQTLDISAKSENSFVFRLDAKAGQDIGGVYGIADFDDGYAHFFNKEYDCSILFTIRSGVLQLNTDSCQEYHDTDVSFDGEYMKPASVKAAPKPAASKPKAVKPKNAAGTANPVQQAEPAPAPANVPKLRKFSATVKDSDGNVNTFELIAKDKDAARAIIRDFRGNPKIMKLKELK